MKSTERKIELEIELQEELRLQYEAIIEEMNSAPANERMEYIYRASTILRRLSKNTRSTASQLRSKPSRYIDYHPVPLSVELTQAG